MSEGFAANKYYKTGNFLVKELAVIAATQV
jgi:hypothetical protein